jgi:lipopolysaccharide/colanic/teichoic acid biosynthesis glycosyltransferase
MNKLKNQTTNRSFNDSVIVVTGVGGVVGRQLVQHLFDRGYQVRVLSRNAKTLEPSLPESVTVGNYDEMDSIVLGADAVIHLAARNNDQGGDLESFKQDNVELTLKLARAAKANGIGKFIFATTTKALTDKGGHYGTSKAIAEQNLEQLSNSAFRVTQARLCPVYGNGTRGRIKLLQNLPMGLGKLALWLVRSLVPIVSAKRVAEGMTAVIESSDPLEEVCLSDPIGTFSVYGIFKALMNFIFVIAVPTITGVPCLIAAIAVATTSKGGVLFIQRRVGKNQRPFQLCKFRTMFTGTPNAGTHEVGKSYVTKVGSFLRKSKMDELPQAWNVLKRELNLIGPRPCLENQSELVQERERYGVFEVLPGITGYGQVAGVDMSQPRKLAIHDHRYVAFRGILFDIKIALRTVLGGGFGDPVGGETASATIDSDSANQATPAASPIEPAKPMGVQK